MSPQIRTTTNKIFTKIFSITEFDFYELSFNSELIIFKQIFITIDNM